MKPSDFRMGNIVGLKASSGEETVEATGAIAGILEDKVIMGRGKNGDSGISVPYKNLVPLPITEEWLLRFGFEKQDDSELLSIQVGNNEYLEYDPRFGLVAVTPESWRGATSCYVWVNAKYVHQIQNLYSALTGEELTTSP